MGMQPADRVTSIAGFRGEILVPLQSVRRAIVVADVVESVRLMQAFEVDVIERWRRFVAEVRDTLLPVHGGRLVKSLGDGMLLEFENVPAAAAVANELHRMIELYNAGRSAEAAIHLRVAAHVADVVSDQIDLFGAGVNLAARLCTLAQPGDTVASADFRDDLVGGFDPEVEDLGECELRHITGTVRAFRLARSAAPVALPTFDTLWPDRPAFAVLPLQTAGGGEDAAVAADVVVDQVTRELALCGEWRVISRLSTNALRNRGATLEELGRLLRATWIVSGQCRVVGDRVRISLELAEVRSASVIWSEVFVAPHAELLGLDDSLGTRIAAAMLRAVFAFELGRSRAQPLPTLASHTLLFAAIAQMHRVSPQDFARGRQILDQLIERHPRAPEPHAWAAKWHVMRAVQGLADDPGREATLARESAQRALGERSDHALGLAVDGLVSGFLLGDLDASEQRYEAALAANPNEALAWLFSSALHAYRDRGEQAAHAAQMALRLSPLDPLRYFHDSFAAHAMLAAGRHDESVTLAERSLRANAGHLPTCRTLAAARMLAGDADGARSAVRRLRALSPAYTVQSFLDHYPGRGSRLAATTAAALTEAGLPAA